VDEKSALTSTAMPMAARSPGRVMFLSPHFSFVAIQSMALEAGAPAVIYFF
jgi:hypothetical protein